LVDDADESKHFNLKEIAKIQKASKAAKKRKYSDAPVDSFKVDVDDTRFAALYNSRDFAIDPTRPEFLKTTEMERLLAERQRRVHSTDNLPTGPPPKRAKKHERK
jgi:hypothetical protein